ncbi:hypothetical protein [Streptomyces huiliensis]|uniref:hypothetical protein n=1 Tax=Streptomyces huiliensis TaxID=2876027 RepID=UPI001CBAD993|nr:hypothetical protein [Streptomyces huiliensis]MBZ4320876.1 hypothetical protein [Streptomyces huiliensis]
MLSTVLAVGAVAGIGWYAAGERSDEAAPAGVAAPAPVKPKAPDPTLRAGLLKSRELPVERYLVSYADATAEKTAMLTAVQTCMARYGLTYEPPSRPGEYPPPSDNSANLERRYGLADKASAERWGYELPGGDRQPPAWERTTAQLDAYYGKDADGKVVTSVNGTPLPEGGCNAEARERVGRQDETAVSDINAESFQAALSDPAVRKSLADWSACMKARGYDYRTPFEITQGPKEEGWGGSPEAKKTAVAEVECKQSTGLLDVWFTTESRIQERRMAAKKPELDKARAHNQAVVRRSLTLR